MSKRLHLLIVISSLGPGGAERVASTLANAWVSRGDKVTLLTLSRDQPDHYPLSGVIRHNIAPGTDGVGVLERVVRAVSQTRALRREVQLCKPDFVISFIDKTNVRTLASLVGTSFPVIVSERSNPEKMPITWYWGLLRRLAYPFAAAIVVQTQKVAVWARHIASRPAVVVIANPVPTSVPTTTAASREKLVVAMGRLSPEKGFDLLLDAWSRLSKDHHEWRLVILGEGPERRSLTAQAEQLGISDRIVFAGLVSDPSPWLTKSSIFVLSSRFEGFPNALLEAMATGMTVVSFDCDNGPGEIIEDRVNGLLVPPEDPRSLSCAMNTLMSNPDQRRALGESARMITDRFSMQSILREWDNLFKSLVRR